MFRNNTNVTEMVPLQQLQLTRALLLLSFISLGLLAQRSCQPQEVRPAGALMSFFPIPERPSSPTFEDPFVEKYKKTAVEEMRLFGIPASITMAQAILESGRGKSTLARQHNNFFGVKCRKAGRGCAADHCISHWDDSPNDMFRKYSSPWWSFRHRSKFLRESPRYAEAFKLKVTDYRGWARALQAAGYATDKDYATKLIFVIESGELHKLDKLA